MASWVAIKIVTTQPLDLLIGCVVGPFQNEEAALRYGELASKYCLGYEKWIAREYQSPNALERLPCPPTSSTASSKA
jgi:hypothetical protein